MPNFNGKGSPPASHGPKGLADMLAAALRGGTKSTLGMPGDLETLARKGINLSEISGTPVSETSILPNTERMGQILPPLNPMTGQNFDQVEKLGEFLPILAGSPKESANVAMALRAQSKKVAK